MIKQLRDVRSKTSDFHETSVIYPTIYLFLIEVAYVGGIFGIGVAFSWIGKSIFAVLVSVAVGKLFLIGHDACHGSFMSYKKLNRVCAMSALTMAFHLPSAWRFWHNAVHHTFTNNLARDFVWRPLSYGEYRAASRIRRLREQIYRHHSGLGLGIYYFTEILVPKMLTPPPNRKSRDRQHLLRDLSSFYGFHSGVITWLATGRLLLGGPLELEEVVVNLIAGFASPLVYVSYAMGFVVYFNHTHPEIKWTNSFGEDAFVERHTSSTVYLKFRGISALLLPNKVMSHVAHHLDPLIPLRHLRQAQEQLISELAAPIKVEEWSWTVQCKVMKSCKLYDPEEGVWMGFDGKVTLEEETVQISCPNAIEATARE
jgi:omega-6 fatty acid desaturase (delta-12 desaturase)